MIVAIALLGALPFLGDAYAICGRDPKLECLQWADKCLRDARVETPDFDLTFEWCAEEIPPELVNFVEIGWLKK
jgi:hypothetical protein